MQLDDVVKTTSEDRDRLQEAMHRTVRWLDRCLKVHSRNTEQSIFPIVQGGLIPEMREECAGLLTQRECRGFAVGGLSGGEKKEEFWPVVTQCTSLLPDQKPRYLMGVGFASDLVVCVALGIDMFDCVFPTRTAVSLFTIQESIFQCLINNSFLYSASDVPLSDPVNSP